jgi:hypothetical protein
VHKALVPIQQWFPHTLAPVLSPPMCAHLVKFSMYLVISGITAAIRNDWLLHTGTDNLHI